MSRLRGKLISTRTVLSLAVALAVLGPVLGFAQQAAGSGLRVLSEGRKTPGLVARGQPWKPGSLGIELRGGGAVAVDELGPGDFLVRVRVAVDERRSAGAALVLGENQLLLDAPMTLEWSGALYATLAKPAPAKQPPAPIFNVEVERVGETLNVRLDGALVGTGRCGSGAIGRFGLASGQGSLRVDRFEVRGNLVQPKVESRRSRIENGIDASIERGVAWLIDQQQRDGSWGNFQLQYPAGQTGLALYALQRCGLRADHPAIRRGYAYLDSLDPQETYALCFALLAYGVDPPPERKPRIQKLLDRLLSWQGDQGWGYPESKAGTPGFEGMHDKPDLSCTQYAVLALRACQNAGFTVPREAWLRCIAAANAFLGPVEKLNATSDKGGRQEVAGFRYLVEREPTGSMTAAGICVMKMARIGLGEKLPAQPNEASRRGIELGLGWLGTRFDVNRDVGGDRGWHLYYLYGIERVGSLLEIDVLGTSPWYEEGAEWILARQKPEGYWRANDAAGDTAISRVAESDTAFALLFLKRATRAAKTIAQEELFKPSKLATSEVRLRATGRGPISLWIEGFADSALAAHSASGGLRVVAVEYRAGDEVLARVAADPSKPWDGEPLATSLVFERPCEREVVAVVHARKPDAGESGTTVELRSQPIKLRFDGLLRPWMLEAAAKRGASLLIGQSPKVTASSELAAASGGREVADGWQWTRWLCAKNDQEPLLVFELEKQLKASEIVLHPACTRYAELGRYDRIRRVAVRLNREKKWIEVEAPADELEPIHVPLGKALPISRFEVKIIARDKGGAEAGTTGWTEIALYK
jgi:hypothetical protein